MRRARDITRREIWRLRQKRHVAASRLRDSRVAIAVISGFFDRSTFDRPSIDAIPTKETGYSAGYSALLARMLDVLHEIFLFLSISRSLARSHGCAPVRRQTAGTSIARAAELQSGERIMQSASERADGRACVLYVACDARDRDTARARTGSSLLLC